MDLLVDKTLDQIYRIDALRGRGGMGAVYRGHDTSLDREIAIKIMHAHFVDDPGFSARFRQEARAIASLNHPGIVQVHACGEDLGLLYIVMDYVQGPALDDWLKRLREEAKIVALDESLRIVRQIAMAVHFAHEKGVLHRDIKPANIILCPVDPALQEPGDLPFQPVLTDFGLARLAESSVHTQTGMAMGTPTYMSPEQCLGVDVDRRTDVYALGILLYELSTGRVPFEVKTLTEAMHSHTQEPPPPPRSINPSLPLEVENVILRALAKRKEDRFPTARAMADALLETVRSMPEGLVITPVLPGNPGARITPRAAPAREVDTDVSVAPFHGDLSVTLPDGSTRRVVMGGKRTLTIGRTGDNDLQLPDSQVSRKHARIDVDGPDLLVVDLHSTNGTFLGDSRLLPGVAVKWPAGTMLHIGSCAIGVAAAAAAGGTVGAAMPDGTVIDARSAAGAGQISVSAPQLSLEVEAGGRVSAMFTATNAGPRVDHFGTTVEGIPPAWVAETPPVVRLLPNDRRELAVAFAPPRSPQSVANSYPITIRVSSQADRMQVVEVRGVLRVLPYYEWGMDLQPQRQSGVGEGTFEVCLENQGNAPLDVQLSAMDSEAGCLYTFAPERTTVPPGGQQRVPLTVRPRLPLPGEATRTYLFTITARAPQAPTPVQQAQGQWLQGAPSIAAALLPEKQTTADRATYRIEITNRSLADLPVTFEAADPVAACHFAFRPPKATLPAAGDLTVNVDVSSVEALYGKEPVSHAFTVTVQPADAPRFARQLQGEWVQLPRQRALWPKLLLTIAGWIIAWFAFALLHHEMLWGLVGPLAEMYDLPWEFIDVILWAIRGIVLGAVGGLFTGIALRWADPSARGVFRLTVGWAVVWGIGVLMAPLTRLPFEGGVVAVIFWVVVGGLAGLIGGAVTGGALSGVSNFVVALGWVLAWAAALFVGEGLVQFDLVYSWIIVDVLIGTIGGAIGGAITLALARRAQRRASV